MAAFAKDSVDDFNGYNMNEKYREKDRNLSNTSNGLASSSSTQAVSIRPSFSRTIASTSNERGGVGKIEF